MPITLEEAEFLTAIGDFSDVILLIEEASHNKLWSVNLILRSGLRLSPAGYQVLMGLTLQEMYTILLPFFKLVVYIILSISHFYYL